MQDKTAWRTWTRSWLSRGGNAPGIGRKLGLLFIVLSMAAVGSVLLITDMTQRMQNIALATRVTTDMRSLSQKAAFDTQHVALALRFNLGEVERHMAEFDRMAQLLESGGVVHGRHMAPLSQRYADEWRRMRDSWRNYRFLIDAVLLSRDASGPDDDEMHRGLPFFEPLARAAEYLLESNEALVEALAVEAGTVHRQGMLQLYALLLANLLLLALAFWYVRSRIVLPLREMADQCREVAAGHYDVRVSYEGRDEIGRLAQSFNDSARNIGSLVTRINHDRNELQQAEALFRGVAENSMVGVCVLQGERFIYANARLADMFGYARQELLAQPGLTVLLQGLSSTANLMHGPAAGRADKTRAEWRGRHHDGRIIDIEVFASHMEVDDKQLTVAVLLEITERKEAEAFSGMALMVYENSSEAMVVTDANGLVINVNPAFSAITGYSPEDVIGRRLNLLSSGRHNRAFYQDMWATLEESGKWKGDIWNRRKNGEEYAERLSISTTYNSDGSVHSRIGLFSDITRQKRSEAFIWRQANYDHLTGLPNRQLFRDRLQRALARSERSGMPVALVFIDLDLFKNVNDTLGHGMGDELLKQVATRLAGCVRATDTVARLGGDEFTMILGELHDPAVVERICRQTLRTLSQPYRLGEDLASVSASMGVTFFPDDSEDIDELLKNADLAMYSAKEKGRNQYAYFDASMQRAAQARRQLSREFLGALEQRQFILNYQPIIDLATGAICKAEAMIRWQHPSLGLIGPGEFISYAEDSGMIVRLGDWVFHEAAQQMERWRTELGVEVQMGINVSPMQFLPDGLDQDAWLNYLRTLDLPGSSLVVEITERLLMDVSDTVIGKLLAFRDAGIQVALDDFGTGYSSLSYLKKFDIDYIKIDQSFVANLGPSTDDMALCEAIIVMAHKLGMKVVAEGVETQAQHDLLVEAGCDYGQGYLYSRPVLADAFSELLVKNMAEQRSR